MKIVPTVGRVVLYCLSEQDVEAINRRRTTGASIHARVNSGHWPPGAQAHIGNPVAAGDVFPADVVRVWGEDADAAINIQVKLDGNDTYWATSRMVSEDPEPGFYHWMPFQKAQAAQAVVVEPVVSDVQTPAD